MHDDDRPVGRLLSRRELVSLFGASAAAAMTHGAAAQTAGGASAALVPGCVVQPQQTEGPYFVDEHLLRSDIRSDTKTGRQKDGAPLVLTLTIAQVGDGACTPIAGARVDVWHCDAAGLYSDVQDRRFDTKGQTFLRGHQIADSSGVVRFTTIYPGWYPGRAVHIHFKVRTEPGSPRSYEFTSQFYFDERLTDRVHATAPYAGHTGVRMRNERDRIFRDGGTQLILPVVEGRQGYTASFTVGMRVGEAARSSRRQRAV